MHHTSDAINALQTPSAAGFLQNGISGTDEEFIL
jgi:hypothetical protein